MNEPAFQYLEMRFVTRLPGIIECYVLAETTGADGFPYRSWHYRVWPRTFGPAAILAGLADASIPAPITWHCKPPPDQHDRSCCTLC